MKKVTARFISLMLSALMLLMIVPTANAYGKISSWAKPEIDAMEDLGLIPEYLDNADLTKNITRLDMCRIAMLSYETLTGKTVPVPAEHPFKDTTDADVEKAYSVNLVNGKGDGKFFPKETLSRKDFFAFVSQFLEAVGYSVSDSDYASLDSFSDAGTLPQWAVKHAQLTVGLGIVQGDGTKLSWDSNTTAEQALAMFYRAYIIASDGELTPPETETPSVPFPNASAWALDSLEAMNELGLIPDNVVYSSMTGPITRADMCKIVMLAYKELMFVSDSDLGPVGKSPFTDTNDADIINAYRLEIVSGDGNGKFRPNDPIRRQEFFKITTNFLSAIGYIYGDEIDLDTTDYPDGSELNLSDYPDSDDLSNYAVNSAKLLISIGVVKGDENKNLHPTNDIVCQEALAIFYRVREFVITWVAPPAADQDSRPEATQTTAQQVVEYAMSFVGKYPYIYGGESPAEGGFDCSGLVQYVYKQFGYSLRRTSKDQWSVSNTVIPRDQLLPGDIIYFSNNGSPSGIFHVAIYIGDNQIVHASTPTTGIIVSDLSIPYYVRNYLGAKRVIN